MKTAYLKTIELQNRLQRRGINSTFEQAEILRRAELTLQKWSEKECGDGNQFSSWAIVRDEETGKPFMEVHPNKGNSYRYAIADREKVALNRIQKVCKELNLYYFHQTDPRGCSLYVDTTPIPENNYTKAIQCCN